MGEKRSFALIIDPRNSCLYVFPNDCHVMRSGVDHRFGVECQSDVTVPKQQIAFLVF
jgi:hypothetical protein